MRQPPPLSALPRFPVTGGIALLAAGVTIAHFARGVELGPLYADENVLRGQVWRFVTSILPHGSGFHLLFNLYWLWVFGTLIEGALGHARALALVVFLALGSSAAQYAFGNSGIGLSGVVYGMWGMLYVLARRRHDARFHDATDYNTNVVFAFWFVLCIVGTYAGWVRIANVAHGVGAGLGLLVGMAMSAAAPRRRGLWWAAGLAVVGASVVAATRLRPWVNFSRDGSDEFAIAYKAFEAGRAQEAELWYRRALRIEPSDDRAWFNLGILQAQAGRPAEAADCFRRARELNPGEQRYQRAADEYAAFRERGRQSPATAPAE